MLTTAKSLRSTWRAALAAGTAALVLSACGTTNWGFPYKMDVQQGNWITSEQVAQLRKGMTPDQVRFILGSPTLHDALHADRWDYPYVNEPGYGKVEKRKFTVWFSNGLLDHWDGNSQPDRQPYQKTDTGAKAIGKTAPAAGGTETGLIGTASGQAKNAKSGTESGGNEPIPQNDSSYRPPKQQMRPGDASSGGNSNSNVKAGRESDLLLQPPSPITDPSAGGSASQPLR